MNGAVGECRHEDAIQESSANMIKAERLTRAHSPSSELKGCKREKEKKNLKRM